ncbi:hypothetical protein EYF80_012387 [Liparis tanakae]|uniref:Uncharacterized protein n=1 Tax=Liparis tanakae TaxID=230148 RepID=A0A4Z2IJU0_9TELE|nr:hypothetical protein EYF80_012387 [Liparis tanakae]
MDQKNYTTVRRPELSLSNSLWLKVHKDSEGVCEVLVGSGEGRVAVGGDEQPLSFHSNTLTQSVSMATDNSITRTDWKGACPPGRGVSTSCLTFGSRDQEIKIKQTWAEN